MTLNGSNLFDAALKFEFKWLYFIRRDIEVRWFTWLQHKIFVFRILFNDLKYILSVTHIFSRTVCFAPLESIMYSCYSLCVHPCNITVLLCVAIVLQHSTHSSAVAPDIYRRQFKNRMHQHKMCLSARAQRHRLHHHHRRAGVARCRRLEPFSPSCAME